MTIKREPLKVLICGAGIGGLTAAISLRQQGHQVEMFEQSKFSCEIGAAIHLPPNAYSMLKHLDVPTDQLGGNACEVITELDDQGKLTVQKETAQLMEEFPYPWLLVHRANLHSALKLKATQEEGPGEPVKIHLSSRVVGVDCLKGKIRLQNGDVHKGDLVIGADGVHSIIRNEVTGTEVPARPSGYSAFRFLIPITIAETIEGMEPYLTKRGNIQIWLGKDRRVVIYPCKDNTLLNFVCIHPDAENSGSAEGWSNKGSMGDLLNCYKDFYKPLVQLLSRAEDIKIWKLLDRPTLTSWISGRVALLGDAAHSFLPHQGQGGAQAIEDGVGLATVFPKGIRPADVPEFLQVYEKARLERATKIQAFTREQALTPADGKINAHKFSHYNWTHDAYFHASKLLARHLETKTFRRMPVGWGPIQGPRQDFLGYDIDGADSFIRSGGMRIKTTKSYVEHLLPNDQFRVDVPGEVTHVVFSNSWIDNVDWLAGHDYSHFDIYLENIVFTSKTGQETRGRFLSLLLEGRTEPTLSGREELGMPKIYTTLTESFDEKTGYSVKASWEGTTFLEMKVTDCKKANPQANGPKEGAMEWRCMPRPGSKGVSDVEYATYTPEPPGGAEFKLSASYEGTPSLTFFKDKINTELLPCHYHVAKKLSEIPILGLEVGTVTVGKGLTDLRNQQVLGN